MTSLFHIVLEMSIKAAIVIAFILIARLFLRKTPKKFSYLLWSVAAFRLCVPYSFASFISIFNMGSKTTVGEQISSTINKIPASRPTGTITVGGNGGVNIGSPNISGNGGVLNGGQVTEVTERIDWDAIINGIIITVWLIGIIAMLTYGVYTYIKTYKRMQNAIRLEDNIYLSDRIDSPFSMGFIKPRIYLPFGLSEQEQECIIAHEKCHIRRFDHIVKLFAYLLLCLHWFNPMCWVGFNRMSYDMEMSCDEMVFRKGITEDGKKLYSATLLSIGTRKRFPAPAPINFDGINNTKQRIKHVLKMKKTKTWIKIICYALCLVILAACAADVKQSSTNDEKNEYITVYNTTDEEVKGIWYYSDDTVIVRVGDGNYTSPIYDKDPPPDIRYYLYNYDGEKLGEVYHNLAVFNKNPHVMSPFGAETYVFVDKNGEYINYFGDYSAEIPENLPENVINAYVSNYNSLIIATLKDGKKYLMSSDGNLLNEEGFDYIGSFYDEHIATIVKDGKIGVISANGEIIVEPYLGKENCAPNIWGGRIAFINEDGKLAFAKIDIPEQDSNDTAISDKLLAAINNEIKVIDEDGNRTYVKDLHGDNTITANSYAIVDMDGDGMNELVLELDKYYGYIILREYDSEIYAYYQVYRGLLYLRTDGTFYGSSGASDNGIFCISFEGSEMAEHELAQFNDMLQIFIIDGKDVTEAEANEYFEEWSKKEEAEFISIFPYVTVIQPDGDMEYTVKLIIDGGSAFLNVSYIDDALEGYNIDFDMYYADNVKGADMKPYAIDVTFDGYYDILVPFMQTGNSLTYYSAFVWDNSTQKFKYVPHFERFPNFVLDNESKRILAHRHGDMSSYFAYGKYDGDIDDFVPTNTVSFECVKPEEYLFEFNESRYEGGEWITVAEYTVTGNAYYSVEGINETLDKYYEEGSFWDLNSLKWQGQTSEEDNSQDNEEALTVTIETADDELMEAVIAGMTDEYAGFFYEENDYGVYHNLAITFSDYVRDFRFWVVDSVTEKIFLTPLYEIGYIGAGEPMIISTYINDAAATRGFSFKDSLGKIYYFVIEANMSGVGDDYILTQRFFNDLALDVPEEEYDRIADMAYSFFKAYVLGNIDAAREMMAITDYEPPCMDYFPDEESCIGSMDKIESYEFEIKVYNYQEHDGKIGIHTEIAFSIDQNINYMWIDMTDDNGELSIWNFDFEA